MRKQLFEYHMIPKETQNILWYKFQKFTKRVSICSEVMQTLTCCICMLPLTTVVSWETQATTENDASFEDNLEEDLRRNVFPPLRYVQIENVERSRLGLRRSHRSHLFPVTRDCKSDAVETEGTLPNLTATSCGHLYHSECIQLWFNRLENEGRNRICAYCRKSVHRKKDLVTVYAISGLEAEELACGSKGKSDVQNDTISSAESQSSSAVEGDASPNLEGSYWDYKFFFTAVTGIAALLIFILQTNEFSGRVEAEYLEEDEFLPFGLFWAFTIIIVSVISLIMDLPIRF